MHCRPSRPKPRPLPDVLRAAALALVVVGFLLTPPTASAQQPDTAKAAPPTYVLDSLVVEGRAEDLSGRATTASEGSVSFRDFRLRPLVREGELLETIPGMILTQHSGDGKSNQMFVRGFNLDHGTDFATFVEGMPVNVVTHAHGQGYTDLNFLVPELVERVDYRLGPYHAHVGDFGSAGSADLRLRRGLPGGLASVETGQNGHGRVVAAGSTGLGAGTLLAGGEARRYDGPWSRPQDLQKLSGMLRWSADIGTDRLSVLALGYDNRWNATDQVPRRALDSGALGRFAPVDPTLGGASSRYSLSGRWTRFHDAGQTRVDAYAVRYDLDLFSNFTYRLDDPERGDQIRQQDRARRTAGAHVVHVRPVATPLPGRHELTVGGQLRDDRADLALTRTSARMLVEPIRADLVSQRSLGTYAELGSTWHARVRTVVGLRADHFAFDVSSDDPANSGQASAARVSPKASLVVGPWSGTEAYLSAGRGFHSNDARGTVMRRDPRTGETVEPVDPLVPSTGLEVGVRATPLPGWRATAALWTVDVDSELLYVGDAGTTEPGDASRRTGLTLANFWRVTARLSADLDLALTRARLSGVGAGQDRIPGAVDRTVAAGLTWEPIERGAFAALRLRHLGGYPLEESGMERADPTSLVNLNVGWEFGSVRAGLQLLNVLDARHADIEYLYTSRLAGEPVAGVEDRHIHPVEPRQIRFRISVGR